MMGYNPQHVERGVALLKGFASELGKPTRIMVAGQDEPFAVYVGVATEWLVEGKEPIRNAILCRSDTAHEDAVEIKRRLEDWDNKAEKAA